MLRLVLIAIALSAVAASSDLRDLQRAKTKIPRADWKGSKTQSMSEVLNGHMKKMFPHTKACEDWTAQDLQKLQEALYDHRTTEFDDIYKNVKDNRRMLLGSTKEYKEQWAKVNGLVDKMEHLKNMHRDGHCHEAVMWLVHHVPAADQHTVFAKAPVPLLSTVKHSCDKLVADELTVCKAYEAMMSCADCHSGTGMIAQDFSDMYGYLKEDPKHPGWARQRRCDQNYKPACGPCEGVGGPYWGDKVADFQPTNCEVVSLPEAVPEADRPKPQFPERFIVHQLGSDRLARTQNQAKFAFYSQVRSTLWYDFPLGGESDGTAADGMARLRHDTYYDDAEYRWARNGLVSEIHLQSREQRDANITGPMVSLLHGLLPFGKYLGGCTCLADPVGVPVLGGTVDTLKMPHTSFAGPDTTYLGRVTIGVEYDGFKMGDTGHGDMTKKRNMTVDHYVRWFLHLFVDADKASPTYGQPVRFYGPYSGYAVYVSVNKTAPPAEVWDTACVDNGWGQDQTKDKCWQKKISEYQCMNVEKTHPEICKPYEGTKETGAILV